MNTTLSPVTVQRFVSLQGELIGLVEQDYTGLTPKLEQIIRAFAEVAASELMQRVHARMIEGTLADQLIGHISRASTAIEARESIAKKDKAQVAPAKLKNKRGRP